MTAIATRLTAAHAHQIRQAVTGHVGEEHRLQRVGEHERGAAFFVAALLMFVLVGFVLLPLLGILDVVLVIVAAIRSRDGVPYRYPFSLRLIR